MHNYFLCNLTFFGDLLLGAVLMVYNGLVVGWRLNSEDRYLVGTVLMMCNSLVVGWRPYSKDWYLV
jgi:hypothetical protein